MKRRRYPFYYVLVSFCLITLFVIWFGWIIHPMLGWGLTGAVIIVGLLMSRWWHVRGRRLNEEMRRILGPTLNDLERMSEGLRENTPFILIAGDHTAPIFSNSSPTVRQSDNALWVKASTPAELPHLAFELTHWRDGKLPEAIVLVIKADACGPIEEMSASLHDWRHALADTARKLKRNIPCLLAIYVRKHRQSEARVRGWFGWIAKEGALNADLPSIRKIIGDLQLKVDNLSAEFMQEDSFSLAVRAAKTQSVLAWLDEMVLPPLYNSRTGLPPVPLQGALLIDAEIPEHTNSPWGQWQTLKTGLSQRTSVVEGQYPLPFQLLLHLKSEGRLTVTARAVSHVLSFAALALMVLLTSSAWHNRELADRVAVNVNSYFTLNPQDWEGKKTALDILENDRRQLNEYNIAGPPLRMGWGLYQGWQLIPPVEAAIASYKPPPEPLKPAAPRVIYVQGDAPRPIVIDSVALFDVGKSQLKPGSEALLQPSLELVKANPEQFFIVAGHTDNTGSQELNQKLSEARAITVRDWLVDKSGVSITRFAIQGYGYVSPIAENESEAGRAKNRRVEITLVPTSPPPAQEKNENKK